MMVVVLVVVVVAAAAVEPKVVVATEPDVDTITHDAKTAPVVKEKSTATRNDVETP
jgi:hypothetical protein